MIDIYSLDHELYYLRCKAALKTCFDDPENVFLIKELGRPFSELELVNDKIRIVLNDEGGGFDIMEVLISLHDNDSFELGYFKQIYNNKGAIIDDSLVIHGWVKHQN